MNWPKAILTALIVGAIASGAISSAAAEPKTLLLVSQSPDNHPPGTHEYAKGIELLAGLLGPTSGLKIRIANGDEP